MIFDDNDKRVLARLILRKSVDFAVAAMEMRSGNIESKIKTDYLARQLDAIQALSAIAEDRLDDPEAVISSIENNLVLPPANAIDEYIAGLSEEDREDNAHLLYMAELIAPHLPVLRLASRLASEGPKEGLGLKDSDVRICIEFEAMLERILATETNLADDVIDYICAMEGMCESIIAIRSGRFPSSTKLSGIIEKLNDVDSAAFEAYAFSFLSDYDDDILKDFNSNLSRYVIAIYAAMIICSKEPIYSKIGHKRPLERDF